MYTNRRSSPRELAIRMLATLGSEIGAQGKKRVSDEDCALLAALVEGSLSRAEADALRRRLAAEPALRHVLSAYVVSMRSESRPHAVAGLDASASLHGMFVLLARMLGALLEPRVLNRSLVAVSLAAAVVLVVAAPFALRSRDGREEGSVRLITASGRQNPDIPPMTHNPLEADDIAVAKTCPEQRAATANNTREVVYRNDRGVPQDDANAIAVAKTVPEQRAATANNTREVVYRNDKGVPQDDAEAARRSRAAAEQGDAEAQYDLGLRYLHGEGVPQDDVRAHMWFTLAVSRASDAELSGKAVSWREMLEGRMTSDQIVAAQRRAREWQEKRK